MPSDPPALHTLRAGDREDSTVDRSIGDRCAPTSAGRPQGDLDERADPLVDLEVRLPEGGQARLVVAVDLGRIVEAPVERVVLAREDRA